MLDWRVQIGLNANTEWCPVILSPLNLFLHDIYFEVISWDFPDHLPYVEINWTGDKKSEYSNPKR